MRSRPLQAARCTNRIALGPRAGQKVLSLHSLSSTDKKETISGLCANAHGFSLHSGVCCGADQRQQLEHLCRNDTWGGDSWKYGGGSAWITGAYDAESHTLYWGTGNPAPDWDGESRPGDNLYTNSTLALDPDTGKIKFHFQYTPHDVWDYDGVNEQ